ncbi:nucleoside phosphorylase [Candidatus Woesearchaeota archaeon]|nr:nucleoside phosphorylase [Candidatus Woesearchaeota archaeon]
MGVKESELIIIGNKIYHLGLSQEQLAKNIFVVGDPARADIVASKFDTIDHKVEHREFITRTGTYKQMPVSVIATGIGTDNNEITLVEMFGLNEFNFSSRERKENAEPLTIIRLGTSGGPQRNIFVGTLAIASYALGLDNTGMFYEYPAADSTVLTIEREAYRIITDATPDTARFKGKIIPYASKASSEVVDALVKSAERDYVVGITASASGFFGPQGREIPGLPITIPRLQEHLATLLVDNNRVVNFEMESSLLFHLAGLMGYRAGTICPIIANRQTGEFLADYSGAVERCIKVGLDAMLDLYNKR